MDDEGLEAALVEQHPDEVWFSAEELVAKTTVALSSASSSSSGTPRGRGGVEHGHARTGSADAATFVTRLQSAQGYVAPDDVGLLAALEGASRIDWSTLPGWPDAPVSGHGLGLAVARSVGALRRETRLWIDESAAVGAGQALLWQLADGLALATAATIAGPDPAGPNPHEPGPDASGPDASDPDAVHPAAPHRGAPGPANRHETPPETFVVLFTRAFPEDLAIASIARHAGIEQGLLRRGPLAARDTGRWSPFEIGEAFVRARATASSLASSGRERHLRWVCEGREPFDPDSVVEAIATDLAERALQTGATPWLVVCWDSLCDAFDVARAADLHARLRSHPLMDRHATVVVGRGAPSIAADAGHPEAVRTVGSPGTVESASVRHFRSSFTSHIELAWAGTRADEDARVRLVARVSVREPGRGQRLFAGEHALAWWPAWGRVEPAESQEP